MSAPLAIVRVLAVFALLFVAASSARADDLRNVKRGEPVPACRLPSLDSTVLDSESLKGSVVVYVCLSAEQRRSELAAMDSQRVMGAFASDPVKLVHVTADVVQKPYFEKFRQERNITAALAFDADHSYFNKLGLIVFPTTVIVSKEGKLANVISLHSGDYPRVLDAYIRHALGTITDDELKVRLAAQPTDNSSPKSLASAHRSLARSLREKGQLDAAADELKKAREQDPTNREVVLDLAEIDLTKGDLDAADALITEVLTAQPDHKRAKQCKGVILFRRGKLDEAETVLLEALYLNPNPEKVHYYLGRICEARGQKDKALEHYREGLRRLVNDPEVTPAPQSGNKEPQAQPK